jgi:endonuclease/exonuclease/phosphatase family metal-dependent hydrolase
VLATHALACSSDPETEPTPGGTLTAVTYNGGLAVGFVDAADARAPLTAQAVADLQADVVCVQEFWNEEHVQLLASAAADSFPHQAFTEPQPGMPTAAAACTDADLADLATCSEAQGCPDVCADDLVGCVLGKCGAEYNATPEVCRSCLQANVGLPYDDVISSCKSGTTEYAFGGSFGIGLLSKYPIEAQELTVLESSTNRRGILYGKLATELGEVHVLCTHLSAVFSDIPYPKATGSWAEEQRAQIEVMTAMAAERAGTGRAMLLGDMNTGPAGDGYVAEVPENYQLFLDAGFVNPYVATPDHPCTFCGTNPLVGGNDDTGSVVIDHVLVRGFPESATGTRVLDQAVEGESCGEPATLAYSDHYGVRVTFSAEGGD